MNTNDKTLANVQPGGRVRLGDFLPPLPCTHYNACGDGSEPLYTAEQMRDYARAALAAQPSPGATALGIPIVVDPTVPPDTFEVRRPSPGGQGAQFPWENFPAYLIDKCEGDTISEEGLQQALAAMAKDERYHLAALQPVGEPVAVVVPGAPTRCRHCESTDLEWFAHVRAVNDVPHGRLTTHDVACVFVLGCNECSETLHTVKADSIASLLAAPPVQAVNLGLQLDRYDAGLLGDGGGGDVNWWQDYLRAELDRAHEFYQDQADAHG